MAFSLCRTTILLLFFIFIAFLTEEVFSQLSIPRWGVTPVTVQTLVLFAGGGLCSNESRISTVDIYDASLNTWSSTALPSIRSQFAASSVQNLALFAGGTDVSGTQQNQVWSFNASSGQWSTFGQLSEARCCFAATTVLDLVLFAGGSGPSATVDIYDATTGRWNTSSLSQARTDLCATSSGSLAFFAGGDFGNTYYDQVDIYDANTRSWKNAAHLSQARAFVCATAVASLVLFAGGSYGNGTATFQSRIMDIYDVGSNTWTSVSLLRDFDNLFGGTSVGILSIFMGDSVTGKYIQIFNSTSMQWTLATAIQPRLTLSATTIGNLALFAGSVGAACSSQVDIFNYTDMVWTPSPCTPGTTQQSLFPRLVCTECSKGYYSNITGAMNCSGCAAGSYAANPGSTNCTMCPAGTSSNLPDSTANTCSACGAGTYAPAGSSKCLACPNGTTSEQGSDSCYSESSQAGGSTASSSAVVYTISAIAAAVVVLILALLALYWLYRKRQSRQQNGKHPVQDLSSLQECRTLEHIEIGKRLGGGTFGDVFEGIWNGTTKVALKKLKSKQFVDAFMSEASILQALNHPNIVRFLGIFTSDEGDKYIVTEYVSKGSLDAVLAKEKTEISGIELLSMAKGAAAGMTYLEEQGLVHRDLALRNILVSSGDTPEAKYTAKVADFGLSKRTQQGYFRGEDEAIAIRWAAPEIFQHAVHTIKSDVWAFGILLWELFSFAEMPYHGATNEEVISKVLAGYQLPQPEQCPAGVYAIMQSCWAFNPNARPSFKNLFDSLQEVQNTFLKAAPSSSATLYANVNTTLNAQRGSIPYVHR